MHSGPEDAWLLKRNGNGPRGARKDRTFHGAIHGTRRVPILRKVVLGVYPMSPPTFREPVGVTLWTCLATPSNGAAASTAPILTIPMMGVKILRLRETGFCGEEPTVLCRRMSIPPCVRC